jgi:hypothetical protein
VPASKKPDDRHFKVGDKIRVNLHHGKIEDVLPVVLRNYCAAQRIIPNNVCNGVSVHRKPFAPYGQLLSVRQKLCISVCQRY